MKREARIILPVNDNEGLPIGHIHKQLQDDLCEHFGGFTEVFGFGGWRNDDGEVITEDIIVYDVAIDEGQQIVLLGIAQKYCKLANQEAIYVRCPTRGVVFITAD